MYMYARIRKYVTGGADLPPPVLNRVKQKQLKKCWSSLFHNRNLIWVPWVACSLLLLLTKCRVFQPPLLSAGFQTNILAAVDLSIFYMIIFWVFTSHSHCDNIIPKNKKLSCTLCLQFKQVGRQIFHCFVIQAHWFHITTPKLCWHRFKIEAWSTIITEWICIYFVNVSCLCSVQTMKKLWSDIVLWDIL